MPASELAAEIVAIARRVKGSQRSPLLFPNHNGRPSKWPIKSVRAICEKFKIRYFTAHDLRRTGMTILDEAGVKTLRVARLAGHAAGSAVAAGAPRVTSSYIGLREEEALREDVRHLDVFWAHLKEMSPRITLECAQDVPKGTRKSRKKKALAAAPNTLSREEVA